MSTLDIDVTGLVVPVDIAALCVGTIDQQNNQQGTSTFAGATTFYTNQSGQNQAYIGTNVIRAFSAAPWQQLTQGIHLHWALPEALTKGAQDNTTGVINFQTVPNRWLISRIIVNGSTVQRSTWIIQSDTLNTQKPANQFAITLPVKKVNPTDPDYQYAGMNQPFTAAWTDPADHLNFKNLTGNNLSAVTSGDASFAAFYPNCNSLFGFYDNCNDITVPTGSNVNIMYQLTGWYSDPSADPLNGGKDRAQMNTQLGWTFTGDDATANYTLYNGIIQGVQWNPNTKYIVDQPLQQPVDAVVTIGNTPPETFAAYFRDVMHPNIPFFETLLNAFQNGLLTDFQQPQPDQLAKLQEELHKKTFASFDSGTIYQVVKPEQDQPESDDVYIPLPIAESLNLLNVYQQQYDFYADYILEFQWQLFSDWYRLVNTTDATLQNTLFQQIYNKIGRVWPTIQQQNLTLKTQRDNQLQLVTQQLAVYDQSLVLKGVPPPHYWQPTEPVVMVAINSLDSPLRITTIRDNYDSQGYLVCRLNTQLLTAITVNTTAIAASQFSSASLPSPNNLPHAADSNQLVLESILLNTSVAASITGASAAVLETALLAAMQGKTQTVYTFTGSAPSAVTVNWWTQNPWFPTFTEWTVQYYPLESTLVNGTLQDYTPNLFTSNFTIDQNAGGAVNYAGSLDPKTIDFTNNAQTYSGTAIISTSAATAFQNQLTDYLSTHTDPTLQSIVTQLQAGVFASQALNGFNSQFLQQQQSLQLNIAVTPQNQFYSITNSVAQVASGANTLSPLPNGFYNPVRAGFLQFSINSIDIYGQKRPLNIIQTICSEELTTVFNNTIEPNIVYMPARITEPARLQFRWLAAIGDAIVEMNSHPATTPICGWFLPNHLDGSMFIYNQEGRSMGTLFLNGNQTEVMWQSAPGDNLLINETIEQVFALENPQLRDLAVALFNNGPAFYLQFWQAVDNMHNFIDPQNYAQSSSLAVLIGRPIALAEAILRLEIEGGASLNQSWATITPNGVTETDSGLTQVQFPVILGDLNQVNDGLIGYFLQQNGAYNYSTFFTEGSNNNGNLGVVKPTPTNILLTASPTPDSTQPYNMLNDAQYVLMLLDPRANVHATMGILPTKSINIPSDMYMDILSILEMTFITAPVLKGVTGFNLPVPVEDSYEWSWIEQTEIMNTPQWITTPDINYVGGQAIADYTPQTLREGWLRLNPLLLTFSLLNNNGQPTAIANSVNTLRLKVNNKKPADITFVPGQLIPEGQSNTGSVVYIHFGQLVGETDVPAIQPSAAGWQFKALNDQRFGNYWAATPLADVPLASGASLYFNLDNVKTTAATGQIQLYYDYYTITGINDGVDGSIITLTN
jgi:hypothetical protein